MTEEHTDICKGYIKVDRRTYRHGQTNVKVALRMTEEHIDKFKGYIKDDRRTYRHGQT